MKKWKVPAKSAGVKLVAFLTLMLDGAFSSKKIKKAIENNLCTVNKRVERFASVRLKAGDTVQFDLDVISDMPPSMFHVEKNRILYEDDALLVYNKPAGITSDTELVALFPTYYLIHRLDRDTTGVILFAKSQEVKESLISLFRKFEVKKVYVALVDGVLNKKKGIVENYLGRVSQGGNQALWSAVASDKGRIAKTAWQCEKQGNKSSFVRCFPETGRTHQIRVHMKGIGHPILGDYRYAKKFVCPYQAKRCMLHALEISFLHPTTGNMLHVEAPLPEDFKQAMRTVMT